MQRGFLAAACAVVVTCVAVPSAVAKQRAADRLDVYTAVTSAKKLTALEEKGIDVASSTATGNELRAQLVMTKDQREAFDEMQATMSVIEGYSDYVMHHVGRRIVPGYENIKERMARSRMHRPPLETAIFRITGLDIKLEQYRQGERFADAVASRVGMNGLNRVWERAEYMPTLEEIQDPGLWIDRMEAA